jgi:hypothetical protein
MHAFINLSLCQSVDHQNVSIIIRTLHIQTGEAKNEHQLTAPNMYTHEQHDPRMKRIP